MKSKTDESYKRALEILIKFMNLVPNMVISDFLQSLRNAIQYFLTLNSPGLLF